LKHVVSKLARDEKPSPLKLKHSLSLKQWSKNRLLKLSWQRELKDLHHNLRQFLLADRAVSPRLLWPEVKREGVRSHQHRIRAPLPGSLLKERPHGVKEASTRSRGELNVGVWVRYSMTRRGPGRLTSMFRRTEDMWSEDPGDGNISLNLMEHMLPPLTAARAHIKPSWRAAIGGRYH
jgi:hypothetical protein